MSMRYLSSVLLMYFNVAVFGRERKTRAGEEENEGGRRREI